MLQPALFTPKSRPGEVRDAILECLRVQGGAARVEQIEKGVEQILGYAVPSSSVRSYLRLNVGQMFDRAARGEYCLKGYVAPPRSPLPETEEASPAFAYQNTKLYRADCIEWLGRQPGRSIHAVVTDPPYGMVEYTAAQQQKLQAGRGGVWRIPPSFDGVKRAPLPRFTVLTPEDVTSLRVFFKQWTQALMPVLVPGAHVFVASNPLLSHVVADALAAGGLERRGEIIRLVMTMRGGDRPKNAHAEFPDVSVMPRSMWEPWLLFRKPIEGTVSENLRRWKTGGLRRPSRDKPFGDVIRSSPTRKAEKMLAPHPSLKPQAFLRQIVHAALPLGEGVVLDPFAGSGSTLAACAHCRYEGIGVEKETRFVELARRSIPKLTALAS